jgi:hypothetical protein
MRDIGESFGLDGVELVKDPLDDDAELGRCVEFCRDLFEPRPQLMVHAISRLLFQLS